MKISIIAVIAGLIVAASPTPAGATTVVRMASLSSGGWHCILSGGTIGESFSGTEYYCVYNW